MDSPRLTISREQGFTLVEVMTVVFIMGVMIALATIRVGGVTERELAVEAQRLYQKLRLLAEEAEFSGVEMGFALTDDGYGFFRFNEPALRWDLIEEGNFSSVVLEGRYAVTLDIHQKKIDTVQLYKKEKREKSRDYGEKKYREPEVIFFSDGQITPFQIILTDKNIPKYRYIMSGENSGKLNIQSNEK